MKKALFLAAALTLVGGAASATTTGFGGFFPGGGFGGLGGIHNGGCGIFCGIKPGGFKPGGGYKPGGGCKSIFCGGPKPGVKPGGGNPSPVPLPAAGFLLLGSLGAFAVAKRRKS